LYQHSVTKKPTTAASDIRHYIMEKLHNAAKTCKHRVHMDFCRVGPQLYRIQHRHLQHYGHVVRMDHDSHPKMASEGKRNRVSAKDEIK